MMNLEKVTDTLIKYDLSAEELFYLQLLYFRKYALSYKYGNFTPIAGEWRENPNCKTKAGDVIRDYVPPYGLPVVKEALVVGNRARRSITKDDINSLLERGFLEVDIAHQKKEISLDKFRISDAFAAEFAFEIGDTIDELYSVYPKQVVIDGKAAFLTVADRGSMGILYSTLINRDYEKHKEIIEKVKSNAHIINFSIEKFIRSKFWESLEIASVKVDKIEAI